ncbi:hypothetical protein N7533_007250 [Penicillium manginii]|uniref:uncharacterized protein n=1 Tax=Penicillium manginii TaxID=203109 RepID=UPI00254795BA|nr:uncharacterized protein N7533_007250 [Penicillium manginii]KAJ5750222.1 hypothetical protein N7533_007250 [Penicillium manginii]
MIWRRATGLCGLAFLPVTWAITFPGTEPTATGHAALQPDCPQPTAVGNQRRDFLRRGDDEDAFVSSFIAGESSLLYFPSASTTVTSWMPQSVCGYIDAVWDDYSSIRCQDNYQCVFHTSDSHYPGMVGCCDGGKPESCAWETVCYNRKQVSATPSVLNSPTNIFAIYCTESDYPECRTWIYPQLDITDYGCHDTKTTQTLALIAVVDTTSATGGGVSATQPGTVTTTDLEAIYPTVAAIRPQVVDASWIDIYVSGTGATSQKVDKATSVGNSGSSSASATATSDSDLSSSNSGSKSGGSSKSTNTGAIAGGVVGGVVGAAGIAAAGFMFFLLKKKRKQAEAGAYQPGQGDGGAMPPPPPPLEDVAMTMPQPMHEVEGTTPQKYAEVDGYGAEHKLPSEIAGSEITGKAYEMDSKNSVAELPGTNGPLHNH